MGPGTAEGGLQHLADDLEAYGDSFAVQIICKNVLGNDARNDADVLKKRLKKVHNRLARIIYYICTYSIQNSLY